MALILLVDDEAAIRRATRRLLERAGYAVLEGSNGQEAVDVFAAERDRLSLVILDVNMPIMGGAEAFQRIRALGPPVPVIVSSGLETDSAAAFADGPVVFLQKPYQPQHLLERVRSLVP